MRWCPACDRKTALNSYGVCRWCGVKHPMDKHARRDQYQTIKNRVDTEEATRKAQRYEAMNAAGPQHTRNHIHEKVTNLDD